MIRRVLTSVAVLASLAIPGTGAASGEPGPLARATIDLARASGRLDATAAAALDALIA